MSDYHEPKKLKIKLKKTKLQIDNCYDKLILQKREEKYARKVTFQQMVKKHALGRCSCKRNGKVCNYDYNELYPIFNKVKEAYLDSDTKGDALVDENLSFFETMYNCSQSITQSLKSCAGKDWENSFQEVLEEAGLVEGKHFSAQAYINNDGIFKEKRDKGKNKGHTIDFVFPTTKYETHIKEHKGYIISMKTSARERVHQDKFLGKFVLIIPEDFKTDDPNMMVITPKNDDNQLTKFIKKLSREYASRLEFE